MKWRRNRTQPVTEADTIPLRAASRDDFTAPLPAVHARRVTPVRAGIAALTALAVAGAAALALVTVPAGPALGAADALMVPAVAAAPVTAVDLGSPALDKAQRAAATSLATARAATLALHQAHLAHQAHLTVLARKAAQASAARAAAAQQLITERAAAKKAAAVTPAPHAPASSGGSSGSPGPSGCSDPSGQLTRSQVGMVWQCAGGPAWATSAAENIAQCESGYNTHAYNPSGASGLFQILGQVVGGYIFDAHVNALNAVAKFRASGDSWAQWVCKP